VRATLLAAAHGLSLRPDARHHRGSIDARARDPAMTDNRKTVLIIKTMAEAGQALLRARPDIQILPFAIDTSRAALLDIIRQAPRIDAMILGVQKIGPDEIAAANGLACVARIGVGYDAIDVAALTAARIPLLITGEANSPSVAEKAMYFMLALAKRGPYMDALVKRGQWQDRLKQMPADLYGKTVLVVGFGRIGTRMVKRCLAMEMTVLVSDPHVAPDAIRSAGAEPVTQLLSALPRVDFVTLHCPKTAATTGLIGAAELAAMKPSAYLVNTARGGIVDEAALTEALLHNRIAGAGLDVLLDEPPPAGHPLLALPNVLTAPHMAGVTREAFDRMALQAATNVLSVLDGTPLHANVVNAEVLG
jgi:D-3-phosphoglycerate dehydrogenase / 2-oxoglutarate reductase